MKTPHGIKLANERLKFIFDQVLAIRKIVGDNSGEIKSLQESLSKANARVRREIQPHLDAITEALPTELQWFRLNLDRYGRGRSINLPVGKLSAHMSSQYKVEITGPKDDVIRRVQEKGDKYVTVTVELNRDAIAEDREKFFGFKGLEISVKDVFKVEPKTFALTENEKELLKQPLRTWKNPRVKPVGRVAKRKD